jgi:hypothetical protein
MNEKKLKKILKDAGTNKKLKTGSKEVLQSIKGTSLILTSGSLPIPMLDKVKKCQRRVKFLYINIMEIPYSLAVYVACHIEQALYP